MTVAFCIVCRSYSVSFTFRLFRRCLGCHSFADCFLVALREVEREREPRPAAVRSVRFLEIPDQRLAELPRARPVVTAPDFFFCRASGEQRGEIVDEAPATCTRQRDLTLLEQHSPARARRIDWYPRNRVFLARLRDPAKPHALLRPAEPCEEAGLLALAPVDVSAIVERVGVVAEVAAE